MSEVPLYPCATPAQEKTRPRHLELVHVPAGGLVELAIKVHFVQARGILSIGRYVSARQT